MINELLQLKSQVQRATARVDDAPGRPVPLYWEKEFTWDYGAAPTEQRALLGNYAPGEVRIHALGALVDFTTTSGASLDYLGGRTGAGYTNSAGTFTFDFEWNMQYNSSGTTYNGAGHTDTAPYLSSECFKGEGWGDRFEVSPLRLGLNESIQVIVRPTVMFSSATYTYRLRFQLWGTRSYV